MILRYAKQLPTNDRIRIIEATDLICARYKEGETCTTIMMPPRYGKSSVIRLSALELMSGTNFPALMTAPWSDNVDQIKQRDKVEEMYEKYGIPLTVKFVGKRRSEKLQNHEWWKTEDGVPTLLTFTIGLIQNSNNQQQFLDGIDDMFQRYGKRIPLYINEAHLIKSEQQWGRFILSAVEAGAYIVLLTGTPVPGIPGFKEDASDWIDVVRKIPRREVGPDGIKYFIDTHEGDKRTINNITGDLNVGWKEAWDVGALARVNAVWIDVEVIDADSNESLGQLSALPKSELNGRLKGIEESAEMVTKKADAGVDRLLQLRAREATKTAQMLVVTGSDREGKGSNIHAKQYYDAIKTSLNIRGCDPRDFKMEIATGVDNDGCPNLKSAKAIKNFRDGKVDILFVKSMGIVGMDAPSCKVLVFGSTLRNGPQAIQALSRVLTEWVCRAVMILGRDAAMVELYGRLVTDHGGDLNLSESRLHLVETEEIDAPPDKPTWAFKGAKVSSYGDELGVVIVGDYELELRIIKHKYHTNGLSDRQIIENYLNGGFPISGEDRKKDEQGRRAEEASGIRDLDEGMDEKEGSFGKMANTIVNKYVRYGIERELWVKKVRELAAAAKRLCGVPHHVKIHLIDDVRMLQRLIDALPHAESVVFGSKSPNDDEATA